MAQRLWRTFVLFVCLAGLAAAQTEFPQTENPSAASWLDQLWSLPVFHFFTFFGFDDHIATEPLVSEIIPPALPELPCSVEPLDPITDADAREFEESDSPLDLEGLTPATSAALQRFQNIVTSVGGSIEMRSAYRPATYQAHLQNVWDKWKEIKRNREEGCQTLRAAVEQEFTGHRLIETQRPVNVSDHTRGLAFDAVVMLPRKARLNRRRVNLDSLARRAGVQRPAIAADPVHFRLRRA